MSTTFQFHLPGITCVNCVLPVENSLKACTTLKIEASACDLVEKIITITVADEDKTTEEIRQILKQLIEDVGVDCVAIERSSVVPNVMTPENNASSDRRRAILTHLAKGLVGSILGAGCMALCLSGAVIPFGMMVGLVAASSLLTLYLGKESYYETWKKLTKTKTLTMDSLFTVSTLTLIGVSIASFFYPWLPMMMEAGLMIFGFRHLGKAIEESIKQKVTAGLSFKTRAAKSVERLNDAEKGIWESSLVTTIQPNTLIRVKHGEVIPLDGVCEDYTASVYDTIVTGSTLPRTLKRGERIFAGMKVAEEAPDMQMRVTHTSDMSYLARLDDKLAQANAEKAPIETTTYRILQYFVPAVLGLALMSGIVVSIFFTPALAIQCAISVLVSACPCTLGFITPLSLKIGMTKANENGVQFKSSKALQMADQIDTVLFDLNGTLTTGVPVVSHYHLYSKEKVSTQAFLSSLSLLENESKHPIAKAICRYISQQKITPKLQEKITVIDKTLHSGVKAKINDDELVVGNNQLMHELGINMPELSKTQKAGQQIVYVAKNGKILGYVALKDPLRDNAKFTVNELQHMGKDVRICTGADLETAQGYAKLLGISADKVYANCIAASDNKGEVAKSAIIEELQKENKKVAMVGDAANDACAIAKCDFGIAVKSNAGDEMTQQQADAVIDNTSLLPVVTTFAVAKETVASIKQNLIVSLAYNTTMMLIAGGALVAAGFILNPGIGVALMVLQTSLVLLNQYRIKQQAYPHLQQAVIEEKQFRPKSTYQNFGLQGLLVAKSVKNISPPSKVSLSETRLQIPIIQQTDTPVVCDSILRPKAF